MSSNKKSPTKRDLRKKHKQYENMYVSFRCAKDSPLGNLIEETKNLLGVTRNNLMTQALIHYCIFIKSNLKRKKPKKK